MKNKQRHLIIEQMDRKLTVFKGAGSTAIPQMVG